MNEEHEEYEDHTQEQVVTDDPKAGQIESELAELYKAGKKKFDVEDIQGTSPALYDLLFDTYEPDEDNGVETSRYKLLERTDGFFYLTKK